MALIRIDELRLVLVVVLRDLVVAVRHADLAQAITQQTMRHLLDSIATRLDETRDISRK